MEFAKQVLKHQCRPRQFNSSLAVDILYMKPGYTGFPNATGGWFLQVGPVVYANSCHPNEAINAGNPNIPMMPLRETQINPVPRYT